RAFLGSQPLLRDGLDVGGDGVAVQRAAADQDLQRQQGQRVLQRGVLHEAGSLSQLSIHPSAARGSGQPVEAESGCAFARAVRRRRAGCRFCPISHTMPSSSAPAPMDAGPPNSRSPVNAKPAIAIMNAVNSAARSIWVWERRLRTASFARL